MRIASPNRRSWLLTLLGGLVALHSSHTRGAVVVISNRTEQPVLVDAFIDALPARPLSLAPGDSRPLFANSGVRVRLTPDASGALSALEPDCAYYIGAAGEDQQLGLQKVGLGEAGPRAWSPSAIAPVELPEAGVVPVKVLVDDDEVRPRQVWEREIRERIGRASASLDAHCGLRLKIVAIDTWDSDDLQTDFERSLAEFEREVHPAPAMVAIGFSSQYQIATGRVHLGGTRGPLHSHIIIKERSRNVLEPERLELLTHELGHFLGATHSAEPKSVMRPVIGQGVSRAAGAQIQFDAPNTLLMSMMAQEFRQRRIRDVGGLTAESRRRMREIYEAVDPAIAHDPAAGKYTRIMAGANAQPLIEDARKVLMQINRVAQLRQELGDRTASDSADGAASRRAGDQLLELYVRQAALAAKQVRRDNAEKVFLLAMGVAMDDAGILRRLPLGAAIVPHIESEEERTARLAAMGQPTLHGRADLAKHFFISANLVVLTGSETSRSAGLVKELLDSHGTSGFSFADMAANRAGIVFAHALLSEGLSLDDIARRYTCDAYMPSVDGLREQLDAEEFVAAFGGPGDARLANELAKIEGRIMALPAYQLRPPAPR